MNEQSNVTISQRSELAEMVATAAQRKDGHAQYNAGFIEGVSQALDIIGVIIEGVND